MVHQRHEEWKKMKIRRREPLFNWRPTLIPITLVVLYFYLLGEIRMRASTAFAPFL